MDLGSEHYSQQEYADCLNQLFFVGKLSGINRDTLKIIKDIAPKSVVDVGCGGGLFLQKIATRFPEVQCVGIDCSEEAIRFASPLKGKNLTFACTKQIPPADIVMATLVCHHLTDSELVPFLQQCYMAANKAVIINDLQRSRLAKALFQLSSNWLFGNRLITHDGIISIERGFTKAELLQLVAPYASVEIVWRLPFRWQVILWKR